MTQACCLYFTGSEMNSIARAVPMNLPQTIDMTSNTAIPFPFITDSNLQRLLRSDASSDRTSSEAEPSTGQKTFTVTRAADPALNV
jgi:hypothetical protein